MSMLIEGPKQPGNDINLYLGLLKEELDTLENTSQYVGRRRERIFPYEIRTAHDGARLSRLQISRGAGGPRIFWMRQVHG